MVRILTGLYYPSEGNVLIGGLDSKLTARECIFSYTSCVFQKFQRYKMNLSDNITISDIKNDIDHESVEMALNEVELSLEKELQLNTMLAPEFNGIELSW